MSSVFENANQKMISFLFSIPIICIIYIDNILENQSSRPKLDWSYRHIFLCGCDLNRWPNVFFLSLLFLITCSSSSSSSQSSKLQTTLPTQTWPFHIEIQLAAEPIKQSEACCCNIKIRIYTIKAFDTNLFLSAIQIFLCIISNISSQYHSCEGPYPSGIAKLHAGEIQPAQTPGIWPANIDFPISL